MLVTTSMTRLGVIYRGYCPTHFYQSFKVLCYGWGKHILTIRRLVYIIIVLNSESDDFC